MSELSVLQESFFFFRETNLVTNPEAMGNMRKEPVGMAKVATRLTLGFGNW